MVFFYNSAYTKYMKVYAQCAVGVGASQIGRVHDLITNHIDIIFGVMSQWRFI